MAVEFKPVYDFALDQEICLYQGDMIFHAEDNQEQVNGKIVLRLLPKPATYFVFELKNSNWPNNDPETFVAIDGQKISGFVVKNSISLAGEFKTVIEWTAELSPFPVKGADSDQLSEVIFHVALSWFSFDNADYLRELFPAFMVKLNSEVWQHSLAEAVSWYLMPITLVKALSQR
ncbi:MAG: hypothetical protein IE914_04050 [Thiotrichales bacterium]|nr:hypothetical protein [Thiotrichales bacterium]